MNLAHHSVRRVTFAAALAIAALTVSSCAGGLVGSGSAATVNGTEISQDDVEQAVDGTRALIEAQISASQRILDDPDPALPAQFTQESLDASAAEALAPYGEGEGFYPTELASSELTQLIRDELIRQELDREDALPTAQEVEVARAALSDRLGGDEALAELDPSVVDVVAATDARAAAYQALLVQDPAEREQELRDLYETVAPTVPLCLNLLYVQTEPEAAAARERVDSGEAFGEVAAEVSLAQATDGNGGFVGCIDSQTAESSLGTDLADLDVGAVGGPFPLDPGDGSEVFAVVQIDSTDGGTFEQLRPQLERQRPSGEEAQAEAAALAAAELLEAAEITIDPRYGTWDDTDFVVAVPVVPEIDPEVDPEVDEGPILVPEN